VYQYDFDHPDSMVRAMEGAAVLYNTYWIRFEHGRMTFDKAVENTRVLLRSACEAGVRRIVHVSITNPSADSPFPYFRGKALVEEAIRTSGLSYAILRPAVAFGPNDILVNNIAWHLRKLPVFAIFGRGEYRLQPIFVGDLADLACAVAAGDKDLVVDAIGPETFTFEEMVRLIRRKIGANARLLHLPPGLALALTKFSSCLLRDVVLTRDEMGSLMANLLVTSGPPAGKTRLTDWLTENAATVGVEYHSELARHFR
jgi:NADH dehydrogenase